MKLFVEFIVYLQRSNLLRCIKIFKSRYYEEKHDIKLFQIQKVCSIKNSWLRTSRYL